MSEIGLQKLKYFFLVNETNSEHMNIQDFFSYIENINEQFIGKIKN